MKIEGKVTQVNFLDRRVSFGSRWMKLRCWYSVFACVEWLSSPAAIWDSLRPQLNGAKLTCSPTENNWKTCTFQTEHFRILVECHFPGDQFFEAKIDGWLGTMNEPSLWGPQAKPRSAADRDLIVSTLQRTRQIVNIVPVGVLKATQQARVCEQICGTVARQSDGIITVFEAGLFNQAGESIFPHNPVHRLKTM